MPASIDHPRTWRIWGVDFDARIVQVVTLATVILIFAFNDRFAGAEDARFALEFVIPMALGIGEGSETNLPLARAVIGGLTVSTFFTLFLVPALYTSLDRFAKRKAPHEDDDEPVVEGAHA